MKASELITELQKRIENECDFVVVGHDDRLNLLYEFHSVITENTEYFSSGYNAIHEPSYLLQ